MPDHIRSLLVLLPLAALYFAFARRIAAAGMADEDFVRRRNLWFAVTLIAFLAHNFWLFAILAMAIVYWAQKKDFNPLAAYLFLLFALPDVDLAIPGFAGINYFFRLSYLRILTIGILLPGAIRLYRMADTVRPGKLIEDKILLAYVALNLLLAFQSGTFTNFLRTAFLDTIDILLPYYVASRSLRSPRHFRDALMSLVVAAVFIALLGIFEVSKHWMLYAGVPTALGVDWGYLHYLERGDRLRAQVTTGQPIAFAYAVTIAVGAWLYLQPLVKSKPRWLAGMLILIVGLIGSFSRGPWIGAAALGLSFIVFGAHPVKGIIRVSIATPIVILLLAATPQGERLLELLPFVGQSESGTIEYRQRLLEVLVPLLIDNPLTGASWYLYSPAMESLKQGEGIVDLVNTYLAVALYSGMIGLSLFVGMFVLPIFRTWRHMRKAADPDGEDYRLGRAIVAMVVGIIVTIATVSSITVIAYIYWTVIGIAVAYYRCAGYRTSTSMPKQQAAIGRLAIFS